VSLLEQNLVQKPAKNGQVFGCYTINAYRLVTRDIWVAE